MQLTSEGKKQHNIQLTVKSLHVLQQYMLSLRGVLCLFSKNMFVLDCHLLLQISAFKGSTFNEGVVNADMPRPVPSSGARTETSSHLQFLLSHFVNLPQLLYAAAAVTLH